MKLVRTMKIDGVTYFKTQFVEIGDEFLIATGNAFHQGHEGDTLRVTDSWTEYTFHREYTGKKRAYPVWNGRWQWVTWENLSTQVTGHCLGFMMIDSKGASGGGD